MYVADGYLFILTLPWEQTIAGLKMLLYHQVNYSGNTCIEKVASVACNRLRINFQ